MPRKGTKLSPEAQAKQIEATAKWHVSNYQNLSLPLRKGKRDAYKRLAEVRGTSVSAMIQNYMDGEYEKEFGEKPI